MLICDACGKRTEAADQHKRDGVSLFGTVGNPPITAHLCQSCGESFNSALLKAGSEWLAANKKTQQ